jgi:hypothetical protein
MTRSNEAVRSYLDELGRRPAHRSYVGAVTMMNPGPALCSFCGRDLWEVSRYISAGPAVICADCLEVAGEVLAQAQDDVERAFLFPPRLFGEPPDGSAVDAILESFRIVFGEAVGRPERYEGHLEGVETVRPLLVEALNRHRVDSGRSRVDRVRFLSPDLVAIGFQIVLQGGATFFFDGRAVRREGKWLVSQETAAAVAARGGVASPPFQWGATRAPA